MELEQRRNVLTGMQLCQMTPQLVFSMFLLGSAVNRVVNPQHLVIATDRSKFSMRYRSPWQKHRKWRLYFSSDKSCISQLRMDRSCFNKLCKHLSDHGGLKEMKYMSVAEQVAIFLGTVAHNYQNRDGVFEFERSGHTIHKYFHRVLAAVLRCSKHFLTVPEPVTPDNATERWQYFQDCLGALENTHIKIRVPTAQHMVYRNRKNEITTNVLAACDRDMNFTYVLAGWEGSSNDSRILKNALARPNGLRVPNGYYLCDNGYTHGEGFMLPYIQKRYHLKQWGVGMEAPQNPEEFFNMVHSKARNVIERCFGVLKLRWRILKDQCDWNVKSMNKIILACCLLQNFIRKNMSYDPLENAEVELDSDDLVFDNQPYDYVQVLRSTTAWNRKRDELALRLYNEWQAQRGLA